MRKTMFLHSAAALALCSVKAAGPAPEPAGGKLPEPNPTLDPAEPGPDTTSTTDTLSPGADPTAAADNTPEGGNTVPYIDNGAGADAWPEGSIGGEHGIDGRAPVDMKDSADDTQSLGEQVGYEALGDISSAPSPANLNIGTVSVDLKASESAILSVASDIEVLSRDVIAGCRDMASDSRCPEDMKIQLGAWADRFAEKHTALGEAVRAKLAAG